MADYDTNTWPVHLRVRIQDFRSWHMGSNPIPATTIRGARSAAVMTVWHPQRDMAKPERE